MKKRLMAVLLMAVMLFSMTACGGGESKPATDGGEGEWPATTLKYININSESMGAKQVQGLVDKFNETNGKNITVEFNFVSSQYPEIAAEVQSYLAAGQDVGVVQVGYSYINYFAENFPQMQDINEVISKYAPEDAALLTETYQEAVLNLGYALNGKLAGLAYGMSTPILYINKDMCADAGLDVANPPKTWEEVRTWAEVIKEKTGNFGIGISNANDTYAIIPLFLSAGMESVIVDNGDGTYAAKLNTPEAVEAWKLFQGMKDDGLYLQATMDEQNAAFAGGQLGMFLSTSGRANYFKDNSNFEIMTVMQPSFGEKELKVCIGGNVLSIISEDEAQIKASWEFMKFLLQPENIGIWSAATGYLPPTQNSADDETLKAFLAENTLLNAALDEREFAAQWTSWPGKNGLQIDQYFVNMRDAILGNGKDCETAIQEAEDEINKLLAK